MNASMLEEAGLTKGEAKVYLALLELGSSTAGPIIKKSGVAKSVIYHILNKLLQKGLVSQIIKEKTQHFQAADPKKIIDYMHEQEEKLKASAIEMQKILPQLLAKKVSARTDEAQVYLGLKGIRTAHENAYSKLKSGDCMYYLGVPAQQPEEQDRYWQKDHRQRIRLGIRMQALANRDASRKFMKNRNSFKWCDVRYMPKGIKTPATFLIYKNVTTIILQEKNSIAVEIVNQEIADSFKSYFDEFWKKSEKFK